MGHGHKITHYRYSLVIAAGRVRMLDPAAIDWASSGVGDGSAISHETVRKLIKKGMTQWGMAYGVIPPE